MNNTKRVFKNGSHNKTIKKYDINGKIIEKKEGWVILEIYGDAYKRGFAHGNLLKNEIIKTKNILSFFIKNELGISKTKYMSIVNEKIKPIIKKRYSEYYDEMKGIANGSNQSLDFILAWNSYLTIYSYLKDGVKPKCSAFIATGEATEKGDIVMAHTTHTNFADGQLCNIIIYVSPNNGNRFVMQTQAGLIASGTDWFITSPGIIGCETSLSEISYKPQLIDPYFCRIRQCMQYATIIDEYISIMNNNNGGDYPCAWLFGDIKSNEIVLFELGKKEMNVERTKSGYFYSANSVIGKKMREKETNDKDFDNINTSSGNRNARFRELLGENYYKKINIENSKDIISDHYDMFLKRKQRNSKGICSHCESDDNSHKSSNFIYGSTDAKVVDSKMAETLSFMARFGSGCGREFSIKKHIDENPEYKKWQPFIEDFIPYNWIEIENK